MRFQHGNRSYTSSSTVIRLMRAGWNHTLTGPLWKLSHLGKTRKLRGAKFIFHLPHFSAPRITTSPRQSIPTVEARLFKERFPRSPPSNPGFNEYSYFLSRSWSFIRPISPTYSTIIPHPHVVGAWGWNSWSIDQGPNVVPDLPIALIWRLKTYLLHH